MLSRRTHLQTIAVICFILASGCGGASPYSDVSGDDITHPDVLDDAGDVPDAGDATDAAIQPGAACGAASTTLGFTACLENLVDDSAFDAVSVADDSSADLSRVTKYLVPVSATSRLPIVFQNVAAFPMHFDFLRAAFPEFWSDLTAQGYKSLIMDPVTREFIAGAVVRFREPCHGVSYGFTVYQDRLDFPAMSQAEITAVGDALDAVLPGGAPLYYPMEQADFADCAAWKDDGFVFHDCGSPVTFEAYTGGTTYGYIKIFDLAAFQEASTSGGYGWQDIVVVDTAPFDIETVTAGILTGSRQNRLSHINVRAAARGTPNAFVRDASSELAELDGRLVRLEVGAGGYSIDPNVTQEMAAAWWQAHRPTLTGVVPPDLEFSDTPTFAEIPVANAQQRRAAASRFGGKAANLATLTSIIDDRYIVGGFAIPFRYFDQMMNQTNMEMWDGTEMRTVTCRQFIEWQLTNPDFQNSAVVRRAALGALQRAINDDGVLPEGFSDTLAARITQVFGADTLMVRLRSSSNVEDSMAFSGAGLYESESACAADSTRGVAGTSLCDRTRNDPAPLTAAIRGVWASFWSFKAFEERFYYQYFQPESTMMGIAVTPAFPDEAVNGVAFTGLPWLPGDARMFVNAQVGDTSVVRPPVGVTSESAMINVDAFPQGITRLNDSSLVTPPEVVMSDAEYRKLGAVLAGIRNAFPLDLGAESTADVILDLEFKLDDDRNLLFKQIRPFVRMRDVTAPRTVQVTTPGDAYICDGFTEYREIADVFRLHVMIALGAYEVVLPLEGDMPTPQLVVIFVGGNGSSVGVPNATPFWWREESSDGFGTVYYRFHFSQDLEADGLAAHLEWYFDVAQTGTGISPETIVIDESLLGRYPGDWTLTLTYQDDDPVPENVALSSCFLPDEPVWRRTGTLPDGDRVEFDVRFRQNLIGNGPAQLVRAFWDRDPATLGGQTTVDFHFNLAYAADHHNWRERMAFALAEPVMVNIDGSDTQVWGMIATEPWPYDPAGVTVDYLGADFQILKTVTPTAWNIEILD